MDFVIVAIIMMYDPKDKNGPVSAVQRQLKIYETIDELKKTGKIF